MATNNAVNSPLAGTTGTVNFVGSTSPTITTPKIITQINDTNGNAIIGLNPQVSSVNNILISNSPTGNALGINASGTDTDITISIASKGAGRSQIRGAGTNVNVSPGYVGEFVSSVIAFASAVSLTTVTAANVTSISLTAGDWDVFGNIAFAVSGACTSLGGWISSTSATQPDFSLRNLLTSATAVASSGFTVPQLRFSLAATTTIYLSAQAAFTTSTVTACGGIYARRRS